VANFKEYYLKRIGLGEKGAQALKPFLEANSTLEKIDLEGNEIKNRGVSAIVKSLKSNTKTNCFIFSNNKCNEQVTLVLSNMLAANNYIQELSISGNKVRQLATMLPSPIFLLLPFASNTHTSSSSSIRLVTVVWVRC
jgi:hypothetical protein